VAVIASFRDLIVWQKAISLANACYALAAMLPRRDQYELASQIRRAAASVPANIAEGHNRRSRPAYANYVGISLGSLAELESHLELAISVGVLQRTHADPVFAQADEVSRLLHGLARALACQPRR
jgi:four helix bundle protein